MKQRAFAAALAACLLLAGCGGEPSSAPAGSDGPAALETVDDRLAYVSRSPISIGFGAEGDAGFYYTDMSEDYSHGNIHFIDKESHQDVILCSDPGCAHDTDACPAYLGNRRPELAWTGGKVVLFYQGMDTDETKVLPHIDVMNPDGSDRHKVCDLEANQEYNGGVAASGDSLYFLLSTYEANGYSTELVRLNLTSGSLVTVCKVEKTTFLMGVACGQLIVKHFGMPEGESQLSDISEQRHILTAIDPTTGAKSTVAEWKQDEGWEVIADDKLFLFSMPNDVLHLTVRDLATGEENEYDLGIEVEEPKNIVNQTYHNGTLLFDLLSGYTEEDELISKYLAFTPETQDLREIKLCDPVRGYPILIEGELGDGVILQVPQYSGSDISSFERDRLVYCSWEDFMNSRLPE